MKFEVPCVSSEVFFFEWGKSLNWPKSRNDVKYTNFNCKAVEVTEVIEKVNTKKSCCTNHRWRRRIKKTQQDKSWRTIQSIFID